MAAENFAVTVAGAGDKTGRSGGEMDWANAMDLDAFETDAGTGGAAEAGDIYYVEEGTYTLSEAWATATSGTAAAPIKIIGVKSGTTNEPPVASDYAFTTARPKIVAAGNTFNFLNYWTIRNIWVTTTAANGFRFGSFCVAQNCLSDNDSGTANRDAFYSQIGSNKHISCEGVSDNGEAFAGWLYNAYITCYAHDSVHGFAVSSHYPKIINCIADTCSTAGILIAATYSGIYIGNTIYNCGVGISASTGYSNVIVNNIIDACTTGASWTTEQKSNWIDHNCWDNTSDTSNATKGDDAVTGDPGLNDPGGSPADFSIGTGSNCNDAAIDVGDRTGAVV